MTSADNGGTDVASSSTTSTESNNRSVKRPWDIPPPDLTGADEATVNRLMAEHHRARRRARNLESVAQYVRDCIAVGQALNLDSYSARVLIQPLTGQPPIENWQMPKQDRRSHQPRTRNLYHAPGEVPTVEHVLKVMHERFAQGVPVNLTHVAARVLLAALFGDPMPEPNPAQLLSRRAVPRTFFILVRKPLATS
ncbi:hypothetical protein [Thermoactinospora rubra]|uniref:hypothetical protein n=1 Tax=Thermoactinospora rubra TaxID=1088767 RepID=UPI00117CD6CD|nr:hypothetical protein [Thermoactinospora rubra]